MLAIMKRIKHNDLTHYFIREHSTLPAAYLASCEKFFKNLSAKQRAASIDKKFKSFKQRGLTKREERLGWITRGHEPKATSNKRQASSNKHLTEPGPGDINRIIKEK